MTATKSENNRIKLVTMINVLLYWILILVLLEVFVAANTNVDILPAGNCTRQDLVPIKVDFDKVSAYGRWNILYITDVEAFHDVDNAYHEFETLSSHVYIASITRVFKDKSTSVYKYILTSDDGKVIEESSDGQGNIIYYHYFPLFITAQKAALYIRCADRTDGVVNVDMRFISIPNGRTLSETEEQQLLEADKKYNFKGDLLKLPRKFA